MGAAWANADGDTTTGLPSAPERADVAWWLQLHDPAIDSLTTSTLGTNPTLAQAAATIDEARALLANSQAQRVPQVDVSGNAERAKIPNVDTTASRRTALENSASIGPTFSWELDLWGRLKESARAAQDRLDARNADADEARLSVMAQLVDTVLNLRACNYSLSIRARDITSREAELHLTDLRRSVGNAAPTDVANAATALESARTDRLSQQEQCTRDVDALVALSGQDADAIRALIPASAPEATPPTTEVAPPMIELADVARVMPVPPDSVLQLPATILLRHPSVVSAEREAAARWSEIAVARAERLPRIDLAAALTGNWLEAFGTHASFQTWSLGGDLAAPLLDGGAGAANVRRTQARYVEAVASLRATVNASAQDVEDALAAQQSAQQRLATSRRAVDDGRITLQGSEAQWRVGAISVFELEDARRLFNDAQESAIAAARDRAQAWVSLERASGGTLHSQTPAATSHPDALPKESP